MPGVPDEIDLTGCSAGTRPDGSPMAHMHRPWPGRYLMGPTEQNRVRVLNVGGERVVVRAISFPTTDEEDLAELIEMLDSIEIRLEG